MKKVICSILAVLSLFTFSLCGCFSNNSGPSTYSDPWDYKQEEAGFYYYLLAEDGYIASRGHKAVSATILGLVNEEKEIDELIIPEILGGYPVSQIGHISGGVMSAIRRYGMNCKNINKIIVNYPIAKYLSCGIQNFSGDLILNAPIKNYSPVSGFNDEEYGLGNANSVTINVELSKFKTDYIPFRFRSQYGYADMRKHFGVLFDAQGGVQTTNAYIVMPNGLLTEPEQPTKTGFSFEGWYLDENCETRWDFEKDIINENMTLYAKWKEI